MNDLATTGDSQYGELLSVAEVFAKSGIFPDARDYNLCAAKLIVGKGMGLSPYDSMTGLNFIKGKPTLAAATMASAIKRSGKYDYRAQQSATECRITFYDVTGAEPRAIGTSTWTLDMAKRAGLGGDNWRKYPEAMLFARCISAGYKTHCPDALGQAAVYVEAHGEHEIPGEPVSAAEPAPDPAPVTKAKPVSLPPAGGKSEPAPVIPEDPSPPADEGEQVPAGSTVQILDVSTRKRGTKTKYVIASTDGQVFETFSKSTAEKLRAAAGDELNVYVEWKPTKVGTKVFRDIISVDISQVEKPQALEAEVID